MRAARSIRLFPVAIALACGGDPSSTGALPLGGGAPSATPAAAGASAAPVLTIERTDGGARCAALVPDAAPAAVTIGRDVPAGSAAVAATSDGTGSVALAWREPSGAGGVSVFGVGGALRGSAAVERLDALAAQPSGFHAIAGEARFVAIRPDGGVSRAEAVAPAELALVAARLAPDPRGGAVVLARGTHATGNHWFELLAGRRDAAGAAVGDPARVTNGADSSEPMFFGGAVSTSGAALAVWGERGTVRVAWLDATGAPAEGPADDGVAGDAGLGYGSVPELAPLLDGGVALKADGAWRRAWAPGATAGRAPPAWLAARPGTGVRVVRGGSAYALVPDAVEAAACAQRVELLDASGARCGVVTVTWSPAACTTGRIDVGRDGTVVAQTPPSLEACTATSCTLTATAWPALLR